MKQLICKQGEICQVPGYYGLYFEGMDVDGPPIDTRHFTFGDEMLPVNTQKAIYVLFPDEP